MARMPTQGPNVGNCTICLPIDEAIYNELIDDPVQFRAWLTEQFELHPEVFPEHFALDLSMKDSRTSVKLGVVIRRIQLQDGEKTYIASTVGNGCWLDVEIAACAGVFSSRMVEYSHAWKEA